MKPIRKPMCDWYTAPQATKAPQRTKTPLMDIRCTRCRRWASEHSVASKERCGYYRDSAGVIWTSFWPDSEAKGRPVPEGLEEHTQKIYNPDRLITKVMA